MVGMEKISPAYGLCWRTYLYLLLSEKGKSVILNIGLYASNKGVEEANQVD